MKNMRRQINCTYIICIYISNGHLSNEGYEKADLVNIMVAFLHIYIYIYEWIMYM